MSYLNPALHRIGPQRVNTFFLFAFYSANDDDDDDCTTDTDRRRGICWMTVRGDQCEDEIRSDVTKADCCASIGKAWGSPCEICPSPGVDGGSLVQPTPGIGVGPDGGPPIGPGAYF